MDILTWAIVATKINKYIQFVKSEHNIDQNLFKKM